MYILFRPTTIYCRNIVLVQLEWNDDIHNVLREQNINSHLLTHFTRTPPFIAEMVKNQYSK